MHDWTLVSIQVGWQAATVAIAFKNTDSEQVLLTADGFTDLHIPKREEWGASVSVNEASDIELLPNGQQRLAIEMQSGDVLSLEAKSIQIPAL